MIIATRSYPGGGIYTSDSINVISSPGIQLTILFLCDGRLIIYLFKYSICLMRTFSWNLFCYESGWTSSLCLNKKKYHLVVNPLAVDYQMDTILWTVCMYCIKYPLYIEMDFVIEEILISLVKIYIFTNIYL